jgi:cysteine desulfurase
MPEPVYFDHAATTPVREEVFAAMQPFFGPRFGNPSSMHRWGREARTALDEARERVGRCLGASPDEVVFTSCGTEADNMALIGVWRARRGEGSRRAAVSTPIEHKAVLGALHEIAKEGGEERLLAVDSAGRVELSSFDALVREDTAVCSVMWVNNEIGTLQDVPLLAERARRRGVVFHTDAVQAFGKIEIDARRTPFDLLSISGHKIGAPKGIGALFIRRGTPMEPLLFGGSQDRGRRPGTENVAMAVGLACAAELAVAEREEECRRLERLRDRLERAILAKVPDAVIHGRDAMRAPHIANISAPGTESESMLIALDLRGVAASGGSACQSGNADPSHVLVAMGVAPDLAANAVRMSLGCLTTVGCVERVSALFPELVRKSRAAAESAW